MNEGLTKALYDAWKSYEYLVYDNAIKEFRFNIQPWINEFCLKFKACNGDWWIDATEETPSWFYEQYKDTLYNTHMRLDSEKLPKSITSILNMSIQGMPSTCLGGILPAYSYKGNSK